MTPAVLPAVATERMMHLWMTDYIANTAGIVYLEAGVLQYTVTPDVVCYLVYAPGLKSLSCIL